MKQDVYETSKSPSYEKLQPPVNSNDLKIKEVLIGLQVFHIGVDISAPTLHHFSYNNSYFIDIFIVGAIVTGTNF